MEDSVTLYTDFGDTKEIEDVAANAKAIAESRVTSERLELGELAKAKHRVEKAQEKKEAAAAEAKADGLAHEELDPAELEDAQLDPLMAGAPLKKQKTAPSAGPVTTTRAPATTPATSASSTGKRVASQASAGSAATVPSSAKVAKPAKGAGGGGSKKAQGPSKKCLAFKDAIIKEYDSWVEKLKINAVEQDELSKSVTDWGRKKGVLRSVSLVDHSFEVEQAAKRMAQVAKLIEKRSNFADDKSVAKANALMITYKNVEENLRNILHPSFKDLYNVAAAVTDGHAGHPVSAMIHLAAVSDPDHKVAEQETFWCECVYLCVYVCVSVCVCVCVSMCVWLRLRYICPLVLDI